MTKLLRLLVWLLVLVLTPGAVLAQATEEAPPPQVRRPYRGLFGAPPDPNARHALLFTGSAFGAYDDNVLAADQGGGSLRDERLRRAGFYSGGQAGLSYAFSGDRVSLGADGGAQLRYYPDFSDFVPAYHTGLETGVRLGRSTSFAAAHRLLYTPHFQPGLVGNLLEGTDPAVPFQPDLDLSLFRSAAFRQAANASLQHAFTRRSSLTAGYFVNYVDFEEEPRDFLSQSGAITFAHQISAHAAMNLGYGYRTASHATVDRRSTAVHDLNVGVTYARALSFSRRTTFSFGTGSAILVADRVGPVDADARTRFRLIGNARLVHEMGRTWTANLGYSRSVNFFDGFDEPFFGDSIAASLEGFVTRRLDFSALAQWTYATAAFQRRNAYQALWGSAQVRYGLTPNLALFARYSYYEHQFDNRSGLNPRLAQTFDRNGVRVGLAVSLPLIP